LKDSKEKNPFIDSTTNLEFEIVSWNQTYELLSQLSNTIEKSKFKPEIIVGISRGGWIPARIISDLIGTKKIVNISVEFYEGIAKTKPKPIISEKFSHSVNNKKILVVDDLTDTGASLELVKSNLKKKNALDVRTATIYHKPWSVIVPNYYGKETRKWVVFPWELKETTKKILEISKKENKILKQYKKNLVSSGLKEKITEKLLKDLVGKKSDDNS
jgi:hypoxanthine phosphoribosyltransferase